jgi:hypothetical protein
MGPRKLLTAVVALTALARAGAADPSPRVAYTNKPTINFPVRMTDADRKAVKALKLSVKVPGGAWAAAETAGPQTAKFTYHAALDGEYAFSFATVDAAGRESPANPDADNQRLTVIVDTAPPEVGAMPLPVASGQTYVQCIMRDANPDRASLRAEAEAADGTWVALPALDTSIPGVFRCPDGGVPPRLRVSGKDLAGNTATQTVVLSPSGRPAPPKAPTPILEPTAVAPVIVPPPLAPPHVAEKPAEPLPAPVVPAPVVPAPVTPAEPPPPTPRQLINARRCVLNYALEGINPAAVTRVEAYATRDNGASWFRLGDDPDCRSPIEFALPDDGAYGIALVVGTAARPTAPPAAGESPDWWVDVDTAPPEVKLESAVVGTGDDLGLLILRWSVRDDNLMPDAVEAAWAAGADGPWQPIAKGLRADGQYRWPVPRDAGARVYLKIEVKDRAGNVGRFVTPQPLTVELPRPRARVIGINPSAVRP